MSSRKIVSFDWAIKYILRDKANYIILEGFLFALLKQKIKIVSLLDTESNQSNKDMKYNRVDLIAEDEKGENIIIEVQYSPEKYYFKRLLYGTSKDIIDNIAVGDDYSNVKKVYSVSLIYFDVEDHALSREITDYVYHGKVDFVGLHNSIGVNIDSNFLVGYNKSSKEKINIFPEYFIISMGIFDNQVNDLLDEWIYSFKNHEVRGEFEAPGIKEMSEKLDFVAMKPDEQRKYNKYLEDLASERATIEYAIDKGREEGRLEEIDKHGKEQIEHVKKMLDDGLTIEQASKFSGLSVEDIHKKLYT